MYGAGVLNFKMGISTANHKNSAGGPLEFTRFYILGAFLIQKEIVTF